MTLLANEALGEVAHLGGNRPDGIDHCFPDFIFAGAALARPHVRVFDMTGRPVRGWVLVGAGSREDEAQPRGLGCPRTDVRASLPSN